MSSEVEDVIMAEDLRELEDATDRVMTERLLRGRAGWPYATALPVKRWSEAEDVLEVGYVRRRNYGAADPVVFTDGGIVASRRYASLEQLLEAGWRAD